jgi:ferredoxin
MPKVEGEDVGAFDIQEGKRLMLVIEEDASADILHRCAAYVRCTTCRIEYLEGEPQSMTAVEPPQWSPRFSKK